MFVFVDLVDMDEVRDMEGMRLAECRVDDWVLMRADEEQQDDQGQEVCTLTDEEKAALASFIKKM
jgi:hypothetical protein